MMALLEDQTASFIVRIWREQGDYGGGSREWRGSIEHVGSGQKSFFRDLNAIAAFMNPYLESLGIDLGDSFWERMSSSLTAPDADTPVEFAISPRNTRRPRRNARHR
jgi:hypothetical protein